MHLTSRGAHVRLSLVCVLLVALLGVSVTHAERQWRTAAAADAASDPAKAKPNKPAKPSNKPEGESKVDLSSLPIPVPKKPYPIVTDHSFEVRNYWDEVRTASATDNQFRVEVRSKDGSVKGVSVWLDANNKTHKTYFVADKKGYRLVPENVFKSDLPKQIDLPAVAGNEGVAADAEESSPPRLRIPEALLGYIAARSKASILVKDTELISSDLSLPNAADGVVEQGGEKSADDEKSLLDQNLVLAASDNGVNRREQRNVQHQQQSGAGEVPTAEEEEQPESESTDVQFVPIYYRPVRIMPVPAFMMRRSQQQQNPIWPLFDPSLAYLLGTGLLNQVYFPSNPPYPWYFGASRQPGGPMVAGVPGSPPSAGLTPQSFAQGPGISQIPPGSFGPVYPGQSGSVYNRPDAPRYPPTVSITRPMSQAIAGPDGEAEAVAEGQAVAGPGASALAAPQAVAIGGPGGVAVATTFATSNSVGAGFGISSDSIKRLSSSLRPTRPPPLPAVAAPSIPAFLGGAAQLLASQSLEEVDAPAAAAFPSSSSSSSSTPEDPSGATVIEFSEDDRNSRGSYSASIPVLPSVLPRRTFFSFLQQGDVFNVQQQHGPQFFYAYNFA